MDENEVKLFIYKRLGHALRWSGMRRARAVDRRLRPSKESLSAPTVPTGCPGEGDRGHDRGR